MKIIRMGTLIFGILAGIIVIGAAVIQYIEKQREIEKAEKSDKEAKLYRDKFELEQLKTISLLEQQKDSINEVKILNEKLALANQEIAELSKEVKNEVTGGDNYPFLKIYYRKFDASPKPFYTVAFVVENRGKYTIRDLKFSLSDLNALSILKSIRIDRRSIIGPLPYQNYNVVHDPDENREYEENLHLNLGTIPRQGHILAHVTATWDREPFHNAHYSINIVWNGGMLRYFINIDTKNNGFALKDASINRDGKHLTSGESEEYVEFLEDTTKTWSFKIKPIVIEK